MFDTFPPSGYVPAPSAVPGIQVFQPAPKPDEVQQDVVEFHCPRCGATTAYSTAQGGLTCTHCGYYEAPDKSVVGRQAKEFEFSLDNLERASHGWGEERKEMACQSCGALTTIPSESLSHTCPFCGSNQVIHRQASQDMLRPQFLIPFKVEPETSRKIVAGWLASSWMVPRDLRKFASQAEFQRVYLPYWTFDARARAAWKAEAGHLETERYFDNGEWKTRTVTRWRWESGAVDLPIDDLFVRGTHRLSPRLLEGIQDFDPDGLAAYEPKYLAGIGAKAYDTPLEEAWEIGRQEMRERTRQACLKQVSSSQVRNFNMELDFSEESWRYVLLPVYLASYRFDGKIYQVMINGQTGEISGQRPADWQKLWLVIAALLAPGLLVGLFGLLTIPLAGAGLGIVGFGFVLLVIGLVIAAVLHQKAQSLDDA